MALRTYTSTISCTGVAGAATGSLDISWSPRKLLGMRVDYAAAPSGTPTVTVTNQNRQVAKHTGAAKFFAYRESVVDTTGAAPASAWWDMPVLNGNVHFAVAAADPDPTLNGVITPFVTVTLFYESE